MPNTLLSDAQVAAAADIEIYDARGNKIRFGALFEHERTVVVFISECDGGVFSRADPHPGQGISSAVLVFLSV